MKAPILTLIVLLALPTVPAPATETGIEFDLDPLDLRGPTLRFLGGRLHLGGRLAGDLLRYGSHHRRDDGVELEDARLDLVGEWGPFSARLSPDLRGLDTPRNLFDAWFAFEAGEELRVTVGQFRVAQTSSFATREEDLPWWDYGYPEYVSGRHDTGIRLDGELMGGVCYYALTATTGHGFGLDGHRRSGSLLGGRIVVFPFGWEGAALPGFLKGLFLGFSYADLDDFDDPVIIEDPVDSRIFTTPDLDGDSGRWLAGELGYSCGWFRAFLERVEGAANDVPVGEGRFADVDQLTAWTVGASVNLTGEPHRYERGRWVAPDGEGRAMWAECLGRIEIGVRYSNADIDRTLFDFGITDYGLSSQETRTFTAFLSWWPNPHTRIGLGWARTIADDPLPVFGDEKRDSSIVFWIEKLL